MFSVLPTIDGYEVVADDTGRPVLLRNTQREALGAARRLNSLALQGGKGLVSALSASGSSTRRREPEDSSQPDSGHWDFWN